MRNTDLIGISQVLNTAAVLAATATMTASMSARQAWQACRRDKRNLESCLFSHTCIKLMCVVCGRVLLALVILIWIWKVWAVIMLRPCYTHPFMYLNPHTFEHFNRHSCQSLYSIDIPSQCLSNLGESTLSNHFWDLNIFPTDLPVP